MEMTCPHCKKINNIKKIKTICGSCSQEITTDEPNSTELGLGGLVLLASLVGGGGVGGYILNDYIERYPIETEYALIESCSTSHRYTLSKKQFKNKRRICSCALNLTQEKFQYNDFKNDQQGFITHLKESILFCSFIKKNFNM